MKRRGDEEWGRLKGKKFATVDRGGAVGFHVHWLRLNGT